MPAYRIGAEWGDAICQNQLGGMLSTEGYGVDPLNYEQALVWFKKAAAQDLPHAFNTLGVMAAYGRGQQPSWRRAREYLQRAIELGAGAQAAQSMQNLNGFIQQVTRSHAA